MTTWRMSASTTTPGWLGMPPRDGGDDADAWVGARTEGLRSAFGDRWTPELERVIPALLTAGLERRSPDDLLSWQVWPGAMPVLATVHARVVASDAIPDWRDSGGTVAPFESATLGPGLQVSGAAPLDDVGPGATAAFVLYAFDDGAATVVIAVEPTLAEVLALCMAGLRELVDGMAVERDDGSAFRAVRPAAFVAGDDWPIEGDAA